MFSIPDNYMFIADIGNQGQLPMEISQVLKPLKTFDILQISVVR